MSKKHKHSLKTSLCLWILGTTIIIFGVIYAFNVQYAMKEVVRSLHTAVNAKFDYALTSLDNNFSAIEISADNFNPNERFKPLNYEIEGAYEVMEKFLINNPNVLGVAVAYEHGVIKNHPDGFAPYVMRTPDGFSRMDLTDLRDYRQDQWYSLAIREKKPCWAKPMLESNCINLIVPYSSPIYDNDSNIIGVAALDLSLNSISDSLLSINPYPNSVLTLMDGDGLFIAHPNKNYIMRESLVSLITKSEVDFDAKVLDEIRTGLKSGHRGFCRYSVDGDFHFLFYDKSQKAGWNITLDVPRSDLAQGLDAMFRTMWINMLIGIILLTVICFVIILRITRPIDRFTAAARQISSGDFHVDIPKASYDDLNQLQAALVAMEESLDKYVVELQATTEAKASIEGELNVARNIQMAMVPKIFPAYPERPELDVFAELIPAKAVGGDLYDFFLEGDDLLFCIGDVSGKGIPGSLFMAITCSLFRTIGKQTKSPAAIASTLNNTIAENNEENMFVTMFIGCCDLKTGEFVCCNCGHNAPATNGVVANRSPLTIVPGPDVHFLGTAPTNIPIGIIPGYLYQEARMRITPGVKMFLYTDGVTEAENPSKELYGDERFLSTIFNYHGPVSARESVEGTRDSLIAFTEDAEQSDDITMLCFRYIGPADSYVEIPADQKPYTLVIPNKVEDMTSLEPFIKEVAEAFGLSHEVAFQLNLALDEAVANSVNYAYPDGVEGPVVIKAEKHDNSIAFTMIDGGIPFDPTQAGDVDTTLSVEDRPIGGLGIFLIRQMMDSIAYQREDGKNILTMIKNL